MLVTLLELIRGNLMACLINNYISIPNNVIYTK